MSNHEKFPENQLKIEKIQCIKFSENVKILEMLKNDQEIVKPKNHDFIPGYRFSVPTPLKYCLSDRGPDDLQRAVNVYHSFRHETYKFIARQHGVVSLRFEHVETVNHHTYGIRTMHTR